MVTKAKTESESKKGNKDTEEIFKVKGEELLAKVKELIKKGNAREILIKDKKGRDLIVLPLTIGVVGAVLAPPLAAIGAIAALVTECTIVVKRRK
ncbi:hypothetical protein A2Z22_01480 [Candidatus Woesebacteria bacterium RBG_16_34_12]|uniref:DUF4342 domain-containing protein n=1 Tax=Candidatus Woesebacteria bacterium RBG_16_34_12 TaxID=1802480 RepID=A0A1F7XC36_9BACT|nr:MAG: hypothetical protein A2Z22_01480 [Candidatus Woesebacteria bacterium RBG_16_34_12]